MTAQDIEQRIVALQQQYTLEENELLRLKPRTRQLKETLAQLNGAIAVLRSMLRSEQQTAQDPVPASNGTTPVPVPAEG
jgi:peptidoglycan hydrolase CwlO-like protein